MLAEIQVHSPRFRLGRFDSEYGDGWGYGLAQQPFEDQVEFGGERFLCFQARLPCRTEKDTIGHVSLIRMKSGRHDTALPTERKTKHSK